MPSSPRLLVIHASPRHEGSHSRAVAAKTIARLQAVHGTGTVVVRDLAKEPLPHVDDAFTSGIFTPPPSLSPAQSAALEPSNRVVGELQAADFIVIDTPMYNNTVPSALKAWIDHMVRPGVTFQVGAAGFSGLLKDKRAFLVVATGDIYTTGPRTGDDFLVPYLKHILGFVGIKDVTVVLAEGLAFDQEHGLQAAEDAIAGLK